MSDGIPAGGFVSKLYKEGCDPREHLYTRRLLFHYTKTKTALEHIFPSMKIRMSSMRAMNDQWESSPWRMNVMGDWRTHDHARLTTEVQQAVDKYLKSAVRLVCFSEDQPDEHPEFGIDEYGREDLIKGWEHDRMWAQYAENHTGICLFFDRDKLHRRMEEHFSGGGTLVHGAMAYLDNRVRNYEEPLRRLDFDPLERYYNPSVDGEIEAYVKQFRSAYWPHLYLLKDPDWQSEQEYRYVWMGEEVPLTDAEDISIEGCLTAICLGASFPKAYEINIRDVSDRTGAQVLRIWYPDRRIFIVPAWEDDRFEREIILPLPPQGS